ncbi:MAG: bifunctional diguanylate cyclase/phosphodiesterase [Planctomycetes bacterium]|nr:bifunctional diguanylate cyclase/phosphodiesterase [Planctomycetota bacterium]
MHRSILLIGGKDDDENDLVAMFGSGVDLRRVAGVAQALEAMTQARFDVAIVDTALREARSLANDVGGTQGLTLPLVFLTETKDLEFERLLDLSIFDPQIVRGHYGRTDLARAISFALGRRESLTQYRTLLKESPDGILIVSSTGIILFANPAAALAFAVPADELVGTSFGVPIVDDLVTEISLRGGRTMEMRVASIPWHGRESHLVMLRDVTDRVAMLQDLSRTNEQLERLSVADPLTGLLNRRGMEAIILDSARRSVRDGSHNSVILIDCDDFKSINERGGYAAGDAALRMIANGLQNSIRFTSDRVSRIGGDEFLVFLNDTTPAQALVVAQKIREAIAAMPAPSRALSATAVTVSLGIAAVPNEIRSLNEVVALAEPSMLSSKRHGKNRVTLDQQGDLSEEDGLLVRSLVSAPQFLRVVGQAIVAIGTAEVLGYELFARGPRSSRIESPFSLFCAARAENILGATDLLCLRRCLEESARIQGDLQVHVNLLPATLMELPEEGLDDLLADVDPRRLVLEMSEQEFLGEPALLLPSLTRLRSRGVRFAIDDVGFGRTSLETLLVVEPEVVKVDQSLISNVAACPEKQRILGRLLRCTDALGTDVIAEGIESEADAEVVRELGIHHAQGYLWSRPKAIRDPETV